MEILNSHDKEFFGSLLYRKCSAECLVIGFCLYIAITFHNNWTKAKIANELLRQFSQSISYFASQFTQLANELLRQFSQSISYRASQFTQLSCVLILGWTFGQTFGDTDFSCAVSGFSQSREVKYFCHRCSKSVARNSNRYRSWF